MAKALALLVFLVLAVTVLVIVTVKLRALSRWRVREVSFGSHRMLWVARLGCDDVKIGDVRVDDPDFNDKIETLRSEAQDRAHQLNAADRR